MIYLYQHGNFPQIYGCLVVSMYMQYVCIYIYYHIYRFIKKLMLSTHELLYLQTFTTQSKWVPSWPPWRFRGFAGHCRRHHALRWSDSGQRSHGKSPKPPVRVMGRSSENHGKIPEHDLSKKNVDVPTMRPTAGGIWEAGSGGPQDQLERLVADTSMSGSKRHSHCKKTRNVGFYTGLPKGATGTPAKNKSPRNWTDCDVNNFCPSRLFRWFYQSNYIPRFDLCIAARLYRCLERMCIHTYILYIYIHTYKYICIYVTHTHTFF